MPYYREVSPVPSTATVSQSYTNDPTIGPVLEIGKPRVLIGWNHQDDTPDGTMHGQLFACVSIDRGTGYEKLSIFDTSGNRSKNPGEVVFCGMANFTMIRMFHPYWAAAGPNGALPRDMAWKPKHEDKARLRRLYHEFLRDHYPAHADGLPQFPASDLPAEELNDDQEDAGIAKSASAKPAKKPHKQRTPRAPKSAQQRAPRRSKTQDKAYSPEVGVGTNGMSEKQYLRLAAEGDGAAVKSEKTSRDASVFNFNTAREPAMAPPTLSPGQNVANPIGLIDFNELATAMNEQARAYPSITPEDASQDFINLVDDYAQDVEYERLFAEWNARVGLRAQGTISGSAGSVNNEASASPAMSYGGVAQSIEQDAQVRGSEDTIVAVDDDNDLQMIGVEDSKDPAPVVAVVKTDGSAIEDAIKLD